METYKHFISLYLQVILEGSHHLRLGNFVMRVMGSFNKLWDRLGTVSLLSKVPAAATAKSLQSCPTLWDPIDGSPPGSPIPGILQARTLEWVAISFSNAWKWKVKVKSLILIWLLATPWTAAHQTPPSMGSSRQEYWSGVPLPSPNYNCFKILPEVKKRYDTNQWRVLLW